MAERHDIQKDLKQLDAELRKLEAEYNMFFAGRLPRPPWETRARVDAIIKRWDRGHIETAIDRFRFTTLQSRYSAFVDLWDRALRAKEEGRPTPFSRVQEHGRDEAKGAKGAKPFVATFKDPMKQMDTLHQLYDALADARRAQGQDQVPFHRFATLVRDQVKKLRDTGSGEVAFRVEVKDGKVNLTVKGVKGAGS